MLGVNWTIYMYRSSWSTLTNHLKGNQLVTGVKIKATGNWTIYMYSSSWSTLANHLKGNQLVTGVKIKATGTETLMSYVHYCSWTRPPYLSECLSVQVY